MDSQLIARLMIILAIAAVEFVHLVRVSVQGHRHLFCLVKRFLNRLLLLGEGVKQRVQILQVLVL